MKKYINSPKFKIIIALLVVFIFTACAWYFRKLYLVRSDKIKWQHSLVLAWVNNIFLIFALMLVAYYSASIDAYVSPDGIFYIAMVLTFAIVAFYSGYYFGKIADKGGDYKAITENKARLLQVLSLILGTVLTFAFFAEAYNILSGDSSCDSSGDSSCDSSGDSSNKAINYENSRDYMKSESKYFN
jgi:hypothetical protein